MGGMICVAKVTQYPPSGPTGYLVAFHTYAFKIFKERHSDTRAVAQVVSKMLAMVAVKVSIPAEV